MFGSKPKIPDKDGLNYATEKLTTEFWAHVVKERYSLNAATNASLNVIRKSLEQAINSGIHSQKDIAIAINAIVKEVEKIVDQIDSQTPGFRKIYEEDK